MGEGIGARAAAVLMTALWALALSPADARAGSLRPSDPEQTWLEAEGLARDARELERDDPQGAVERYLGAARLFEALADEREQPASACWRGARAFWAAGDTLALEEKRRRVEYFARAEALSQRGIAADPGCAECMLWKFAAMGRLRTTRGIWTGLRQLPEMAELLDRGIALAPNHADDDRHNSTLGNLHYSSAIFYRVFPDWFWIGWVTGVRGDKERALGHAQTALALHPARLDYRIELGAQLLCLGAARDDRTHLEHGRAALSAAVEVRPETQDDEREIAAARIMLDEPSKSCGYSGDTWVEIDRDEAMRAARRGE